MLLGLDPVLGPDLLHALAAMGHGDRIVLVDANYPATRGRRLIQLPGIDMPRALQAVLSVFPIDTFIPEPCAVMQVVGEPDALPPVQAEMNAVLVEHGAKPAASLERHTFYAAAETAHAIVQTGERRFYGDILLAELRLPTRQLRIKAKAATKSSSLKGLQSNGAALNSGGISDGRR
jgi:L-fucose mutarotase